MINDKPYVRCDEVKVGDILVADGGFTCIHEERRCEVFHDGPKNELFVMCCGEGPDFRLGETGGSDYKDRHYLDGQYEDDHYIGFRKETL